MVLIKCVRVLYPSVYINGRRNRNMVSGPDAGGKNLQSYTAFEI